MLFFCYTSLMEGLLMTWQGTVVLLFIFTMDDSLFPRHALARSAAAHHSSTISHRAPDAQQKGDDTKKEASADLTREPTLAQGRTDLLPRNYLHVLSPMHRWKEDKTTWWQYFRRPFHLFAFPNIIMVHTLGLKNNRI
jgi:hypothetical protein